jgi:hypothetical protein
VCVCVCVSVCVKVIERTVTFDLFDVCVCMCEGVET